MVKRMGMVIVGATLVVAHCLIGGQAFALLQDNGQPCPPECVTDSMEIVTWYPSPYNEYEELRLYPVQREDTYCTDDKKGLMYYDDNNTSMDASDDKVRVCMGSSAWTGGGWQSAGHWEYISGTTDIKPSNSGTVKIRNLKIDQTTQDGYVLTSDANGNASWKASSGGMFSNSRTFTSSGTFLVPNNVAMVMVEVWSGGGGGGGAYSCYWGGSWSGTWGPGGNGGDSSFGALIIANGGLAGAGNGGSGGTCSAVVNSSGNSGNVSSGGTGGNGAGQGGAGGVGALNCGNGCGGGNGGGGGGGAYGKGVFTVVPGTSYSVTVGGGGGAGSGQQSNCGKAGDGKSGGSGKVVVYY